MKLEKGKTYLMPGGRRIKVLTVSPWGSRAYVQPLAHTTKRKDNCGATIEEKEGIAPYSISLYSLLEEAK